MSNNAQSIKQLSMTEHEACAKRTVPDIKTGFSAMRKAVSERAGRIPDRRIRGMYERCFYSTLDTTTEFLEDGTTYVFTGDIPAMWLRDSSVQVTGYLQYASVDSDVRTMIKGLLQRQFLYIAVDPYANAFNKEPNGHGHKDDLTDFDSPAVWERKYEIDSLCYPIWLARQYVTKTGDTSVYTKEYEKAAMLIVDLFIVEQDHFGRSSYVHQRPKYPQFPTLSNGGKGKPVGYTGMTWSGYRPSDDVCEYNYLVPANMFAVVVLRELETVFAMRFSNSVYSQKAAELHRQIEEGIRRYGVYAHPEFGDIYVYETDGLGNVLLMDDANVPSLLSLPYLGYCSKTDPIYQNTRRFILSKNNPYYYEGKKARGIGSPHTPEQYIWHISLCIQLLTSTDAAEIDYCFTTLIGTDGGTGLMHEGFHCDDDRQFTREWFAWANTLFAMATDKYYFSIE